jgi:hypothetical protein
MVLLALPPADHLLNERDRGQFVASRRRRMMANARAERLLKIPAEPSPELRIPAAAAQARVVSMAGIRLGSWESARAFKGIICDDISEFESSHASHAVWSPPANSLVRKESPNSEHGDWFHKRKAPPGDGAKGDGGVCGTCNKPHTITVAAQHVRIGAAASRFWGMTLG